MYILSPVLMMVLVVFGMIVFPIWMIVHCATSALDGKAKTIWIIVLLLTWSLGAMIYGLFACPKKSAPWMSAIGIICLFLLNIPPMISLANLSKQMFISQAAKIDQFDTQELSPSQSALMKDKLGTIGEEMSFGNFQRMQKATGLAQLFYIYSLDKKITLDEYQTWTKYFDSRDQINMKEFTEYIRRLRHP
jgi:hypothetical protein